MGLPKRSKLLMTAHEILQKAKDEGFALGAFNAGNLEIAKAIIQAAESQNSPLIIETSSGEAEHFGQKNFLDVIKNAKEENNLPLFTNLDHGPGLEECQRAIELGYDLIQFDGSVLPLEENIKITKVLVQQAHEKGILVEAEIDKILGESQQNDEASESVQARANYTDPDKAFDFVSQTGCDLLAVFVGNLHGVYRDTPKLDLDRLKILAQKLPCFLSLHGGSGLSEDDIQKAIQVGRVVKINVNTELRLAYKETLENVLRGSDEVAVYKLMPPVIAAVQKIVEEKIQLFRGSSRESPEESTKVIKEDEI